MMARAGPGFVVVLLGRRCRVQPSFECSFSISIHSSCLRRLLVFCTDMAGTSVLIIHPDLGIHSFHRMFCSEKMPPKKTPVTKMGEMPQYPPSSLPLLVLPRQLFRRLIFHPQLLLQLIPEMLKKLRWPRRPIHFRPTHLFHRCPMASPVHAFDHFLDAAVEGRTAEQRGYGPGLRSSVSRGLPCARRKDCVPRRRG